MRTKALLLTAALGLAGAATSMAQAVYSVNVVGYINLTMKPGFNLVANQLKNGNNNLSTILPGAANEAQVLKFANNNYNIDITDGVDWFDFNTGEPSTTTVNPGEGFFFFQPNAAGSSTVTLVGEVTTGNGLSVSFPRGFSLVSSIVPQQIDLTSANGFPLVNEAQFLTFNPDSQSFNTILITDGVEWFNFDSGETEVASAGVGQGFFFFNPTTSALNWTRNFNPNN